MKTPLINIESKIVKLSELKKRIEKWKINNETTVFTNGCFDLIHRGHIEYLAKASSYGDKFIIAVNSDDSVRRLNKGETRPLQDEQSRALITASFEFVDAVIVFNDDTPLGLISQILPNTLIKGGDYDPSITDKNNKQYIVGSDVVRINGGETKIIDFLEGYSTSKIEEKIKNSSL